MVTKAEACATLKKGAERCGLKFHDLTTHEVLQGHTAAISIGLDPTVPPPVKPPITDFKDAGANI